MQWWHAMRALLTKNWIIKRRHPIATWSEVVNPLICIILFALLKSMDTDLTIPAGWSTDKVNASLSTSGSSLNLFTQTDFLSMITSSLSDAGLSTDSFLKPDNSTSNGTSYSALLLQLTSALQLPDFYFTETTMSGLLVSLALQSLMEADHLDMLSERDLMDCVLKFLLLGYTGAPNTSYSVPAECRGRIVPYRVAITPDTTFTRQYFSACLEKWHPRLALAPSVLGVPLLSAPSFRNSRLFFDNETALEDYMASVEYGSSLDKPKVYAAIAFQRFPADNSSDFANPSGYAVEYSLRFNSTRASSGFPSSVPHTRQFMESVARLIDSEATASYTTRGFMTLQTSIARFVNCVPEWDATAQTTNGKCQITEAVANTSSTNDQRFLRQVENDMILSSAFEVINTMTDILMPNSGLSERVSMATIPASSIRTMLVPLRIVPQPYYGAGVFVSPTDIFRYAPFYDKVRIVFPIGFILSYLYTVSRMVVAFLTEKETRSRELMKILGTSESHIFTAWLVTYIQILTVATALQTAGAKAFLFPNSSTGLLFAFFFTFALSSFGFAFLVSAFFSRARAGSFVGMALFFMAFFVSFSFGDDTTKSQRTWACVLSPVALARGINSLAIVEAVSIGITAVNVDEVIGGISFMNVIYMQAIDFVAYIAVAKYVEKVVPQEFGVPDRWYFFVTRSYWRRVLPPKHQKVAHTQVEDANEIDNSGSARIERVPPELKMQVREARAIVIAGLRKQFEVAGGGVKIAVNGLRLTLYENQVTCLLGHNGAGKSTLMSMLTGMTPPTSGDAWIRGHSITTELHHVRRSLGYCPQASVLYPELTVEEHLRFYGRIKGITSHTVLAREVAAKMAEVALTSKRTTVSRALSGGMQRRLSLAIAFLGDSKVVFLDEPTSGMDPYSRRSTWELIQRNRHGRVVVLTTHFMDEADILGDRIAILADGQLQCVGSSHFLKQHFGVGYYLRFTRSSELASAGTDDRLTKLITNHVPQLLIASNIGTELAYQLPFESAPSFPALFRELDSERKDFGILSYAISVTTLEEVFLKVLEHGQSSGDNEVHEKTQAPLAETPEAKLERSQAERKLAFVNQFGALVKKRGLYGKRDKHMIFFRTILPVIVIFAGLSALKQSMFLKNDPKMMMETARETSFGEGKPVSISSPGMALSVSAFSAVAHPSLYQGGRLFEVAIEEEVYDASETPTVFGVAYTSPSIQSNDTSGYCLRFGELAYQNGYGRWSNGSANGAPQIVDGQCGGYVVYGSTEDRIMAYNIMVNSSLLHAPPILKAMMDTAIHRNLLANHAANAGISALDTQELTIRVASHPLPLSFKTRSLFSSFLSLPAVIFIVIAFTFIPASVMPYLVKEKHAEQNAKYQQVLSGVSLPAYWLANFVFDTALYCIPMVAAIVLLSSYGVSSSLSGESKAGPSCPSCTRNVPEAVVALFVLFGGAVAPWTYLLSHLMRDPRACLLYTVMINFVLGIVLILVSYTMSMLSTTRAANSVLVYVWRLSPLFSLGMGLLSVIVADIKALYGLSSTSVSAFDSTIAGTEIGYLAVQCPVYFCLTIIIDEWKSRSSRHDSTESLPRWLFKQMLRCTGRDALDRQPTESKLDRNCEEDDDIIAEGQRVNSAIQPQAVKVLGLRKIYPNGKIAVKQLTFGLAPGECFGFLGINGAGKTSTIKILTGDLAPSEGDAFLSGFSILTQRREARQSIGYCPQFDALLDLLTVREHLELFARLKGFASAKAVNSEVVRLLHKLHLDPFAQKLAFNLSGGNKRKLSVAIAMLGDPKVIFLDEPSTGMDPASRRLLWDVILDASTHSKKSTVVLTTHSMDECEALCSKAGIMVDGRLQCLGTIPHLKARFGDGFLLECKLEVPSATAVSQIQSEVQARLGASSSVSSELSLNILSDICSAIGHPERADTFRTAFRTGTESTKPFGVVQFCAWWVVEDRMEALGAFLRRSFGQDDERHILLLERQGDYCRYKISRPMEGAGSPLAAMFEVIEGAKRSLSIQEYSIAHTSLEQIFNNFAQQQANDQHGEGNEAS